MPCHAAPAPNSYKQHRARQRAKGLRLVQLWLPDTRSRGFAAQVAHDIATLKETPEDKAFGAALEAGRGWRTFGSATEPGAVVTASVGDPAGKPRPFVVLRSDHFAEHAHGDAGGILHDTERDADTAGPG